MALERIELLAEPELNPTRLVLAFGGWMDGGDVSTGTVEYLIEALGAVKLAELDAEDFYLCSFPGSMEVSAMLRPMAQIEQGLIGDLQGPGNTFYLSEPERLMLFAGKEPNLRWREYAEQIFDLVERFEIEAVYFIGSVGGAVPHTRDPRLYGSFSSEAAREDLAERFGFRLLDYEGPASIATFLCQEAGRRGLAMANIVAEIPAYVQGRNVRCIQGMLRKLGAVLDLQMDLEELREASDDLEEKINETVADREDLAELVEKLESDYDNEMFDSQMGDFKQWLERRGIRLD